MHHFPRLLFPLLLSLLFGPAAATEPRLECPTAQDRAASSPSLRRPHSVLLVPLLHSEAKEPESWPEQPARRISDFYRARFGARTEWMRGIRTWRDFFRQAERMQQRGERFDRIILIGHGGFDGPILNVDLIRSERTAGGGNGTAVRILEDQPGVENFLEVRYDTARNAAFNVALASEWDQFGLKPPSDIMDTLSHLETALEPPDSACLRRNCPASKAASASRRRELPIQQHACESACRNPLFVSRSGYRESSERFRLYTESLRALTRPGGLILIGTCNTGSTTPAQKAPWEVVGVLTLSQVAGGPYPSYVQLLAAATDRTVAGPIGQTSAADIVERVRLFESGHHQVYLRIAGPPACR